MLEGTEHACVVGYRYSQVAEQNPKRAVGPGGESEIGAVVPAEMGI